MDIPSGEGPNFLPESALYKLNIHFFDRHNFTISCSFAFIKDVHFQDCDEYFVTRYFPESVAPYTVEFSSDCDIEVTLDIVITDPEYKASNTHFSLGMVAFDKEFDNYDPGSDPNSRNVGNASTPFELSLYDKNSYILSQPKEDIIPFRNQYQKTILTTTFNLHNEKENFKVEEYENNLMQKRPNDDLEKRVEHIEKILQLYKKYIIDTSLLTSIKTNLFSSP
ncbi:hypothetical protein C2G38_2031002 [Gigaspora rosea]|uniref:Uncharacterized protein n=1 Tax=Gigaspora rosea TaxID=44941 RepID=A0A397VZR4_9GLOM|nr:hypothetical protein C2G38_2031002 [Gigaspora rosea]